jgi:hypothetical protein
MCAILTAIARLMCQTFLKQEVEVEGIQHPGLLVNMRAVAFSDISLEAFTHFSDE